MPRWAARSSILLFVACAFWLLSAGVAVAKNKHVDEKHEKALAAVITKWNHQAFYEDNAIGAVADGLQAAITSVKAMLGQTDPTVVAVCQQEQQSMAKLHDYLLSKTVNVVENWGKAALEFYDKAEKWFPHKADHVWLNTACEDYNQAMQTLVLKIKLCAEAAQIVATAAQPSDLVAATQKLASAASLDKRFTDKWDSANKILRDLDK
jgi:hypothetical protein